MNDFDRIEAAENALTICAHALRVNAYAAEISTAEEALYRALSVIEDELLPIIRKANDTMVQRLCENCNEIAGADLKCPSCHLTPREREKLLEQSARPY